MKSYPREQQKSRKYPVAAVYLLLFLATYLFVIIASYTTPGSIAGIWLIPASLPWGLFLQDWPSPFFDLFFFAAAGVNALLIGVLEHRLRARRDNR